MRRPLPKSARASGAVGYVRSYLSAVLMVVVVVVLWQVLTPALKIPGYFLPLPSSIFALLTSSRVNWAYNAYLTISEATLGFAAAVAVGIPVAVLISFSKTFRDLVEPLIIAAQLVPKVALIPILFLWLGYDVVPRLVAVFLVCFFPVVISSAAGFLAVDDDLVDLVRSFSSSRLLLLRKVSFPTALPSVFSGLKIAIVLAPIGAVVAEFISSQAGLGFLILAGQDQLNTTLIFASTTVLVLGSFFLYGLVLLAEKLVIPWSK